jgi:hypothetical protein
MNFLISSTLWVIFSLLNPDPDSEYVSGSSTDPGPKHCLRQFNVLISFSFLFMFITENIAPFCMQHDLLYFQTAIHLKSIVLLDTKWSWVATTLNPHYEGRISRIYKEIVLPNLHRLLSQGALVRPYKQE